MRFLILLKSNLKRLIKNKTTMIATVAIPFSIILALGFLFNNIIGSDSKSVVVNMDKGSYGSEFVKEIQSNTKIEVCDKNEATKKLKNKNISVFYEIPEDFSAKLEKGEKPQIFSYKSENNSEFGNFQLNADSLINHMLLRNEFKNNNKDVSLKALSYEDSNITIKGNDKNSLGDTMVLNLIISFALFSSIGISMELFHLSEQNILVRSFTTANKPGVIIGAVLAAMFIISAVSYSSIYMLSALFNSHNMIAKAPIAILNITCLALVSLSLGILVTRMVKGESYINVALQIIVGVTCFVGGSFMPYELLPKSITAFSKFTPQYWAIQSINTQKPEYALIVLLFSVALFTAGTFKVRKIA
ncbi:ABC transporter permease [Clostridium sp. YIM B02505]|uniref:ABC transporter permease n=1 Tax=Clostridium yunnanense TaxID=2800325 RepID=A0ABS1ENM4_9CLOT|nr:ABC transporter permease [Clostridium yunnanense]MBK1810929.1 ABC transporter permease [Clostridium yunnanense]